MSSSVALHSQATSSHTGERWSCWNLSQYMLVKGCPIAKQKRVNCCARLSAAVSVTMF